jgi:hypothetical protein
MREMKGGGSAVSMMVLWVKVARRKVRRAGARVVVGKCFVRMPRKECRYLEMVRSLDVSVGKVGEGLCRD